MDTNRTRDFDDHEFADAGVYILLGEVNGVIACKIGMSSFVQNRIYQVCQTSPFDLVHAFILSCQCRADAISAERALHGMLKKYRSRGEWFMFDPSDASAKPALHSAIATVSAMRNIPRVSIPVADIRLAVKFWKSEIQAAIRADRKERKKYGRQRSVIEAEKKMAEKADRYARSVMFEEHHAKQRAEALALRTFPE